MADRERALPITAPILAEHYKDVASFQRRRALLARFLARGLVVVTAVSLLANLGLAWSLASLLPLARLVPVYLLIRQDGTIDTQVALSTLPASTDQAVIRAALWQYVAMREGYAYEVARYRYDIVSGMSDPTTRALYQAWFNYPNPKSPQVAIGKNGVVTVRPLSVALIGPSVAQVRYERTYTAGTNAAVISTWTATLQFRQVDSMPASERLSDPGGIIVTNYQNEENSAP